jgi:hypothetical protein
MKDAYFKAAKAYEDMMIKPKNISRDDWIKQEVAKATQTEAQPSSAAQAVPSDINALLKKYGGK